MSDRVYTFMPIPAPNRGPRPRDHDHGTPGLWFEDVIDGSLDPCPFCGESSHLGFERDWDGAPCVNAHCVTCGADGDWFRTRAEARAAWNRRTNPRPGP
jgi:Lar family restriction alleviation protein